MESVEAIQKQIEYYMSDKNLENDEFFHTKISEAKEVLPKQMQGYLEIDILLNCNKIKKLGVKSSEDLLKAIEKSQELEVHPSKKLFRRKPQLKLPELKTKKVKPNNAGDNVAAEKNPNDNPYKSLETYSSGQLRVIFTLTTDKEVTVNFKFIVEALLRTYGVHPPYTRFNKTEGNFAINKKEFTTELAQRFEKEGLTVGADHFKIVKTEGKLLDEFNEKHRFHYQGIVDKLKKDFESKLKEEKRNKKNQPVNFTFGGESYTDINKLKSLFKNILSRAANNNPLPKKEQDLIVELLQFHEKGGDKTKDMKHIVVDVHPEHKDTRCFFVVRNDGTREDFSAVKCITHLEEKLHK